MNYHGRRKPYTAIGISRKACARCGSRAMYQWSICANGNRFVPICDGCDIALNAAVLAFMGFDNADELMAAYRRTVEHTDG